jgi:DNA polymerase elongation subunit (family B)
MNEHMFTEGVDYVIASDTDSVYLNMEAMVKKKYGPGPFTDKEKHAIVDLLHQVTKFKLQSYLDECYIELQKRVNADKQKMQMNRESIADVGIWTGKKRYALNIWDKEEVRFETPKIEIKGIDSVRSSTPAACRVAIKELIKIVIDGNEEAAQKYISDFWDKFQKLPFEDIAFPRGINGLEEYADDTLLCKSGTPVQVRGALVYNQMLEERGIKNFSPLYDGDKAKFCYLQTPNSVRSYVITVPHALPQAFQLEDKIDREKQFEVAFLSPVTKIMNAVGWKAEPEGNTLEDFMNGG